MSKPNQHQIDELAAIMQLLANVGPGDQEEVMKAGAQLEDAIASFGDVGSQLERLIDLSWEGIKHLFQKDEYFMTVKMASLQAINLIREYAITDGNITVEKFEKACSDLDRALKGDGESADKIIDLPEEKLAELQATPPVVAEKKSPSEPDPIPVVESVAVPSETTLDDVSSYLMSLNPSELDNEHFAKLSALLSAAFLNESSAVGAKLQHVISLTEVGDDMDFEAQYFRICDEIEAICEARQLELVMGDDPSPNAAHPSSSDASDEKPKQSADVEPSVPSTLAATTTAPEAIQQRSFPQFFTLPAESDSELLKEYYAECSELIGIAEAALLDLENAPDDDELVNKVFRSFHTVKGTSAFLGLDPISDFAHATETLLSLVRENEMAYDAHCADITLASLDIIKHLVESVSDKSPGDQIELPDGYGALLTRLEIVAESGSFDSAPTADTVTTPTEEVVKGSDVIDSSYDAEIVIADSANDSSATGNQFEATPAETDDDLEATQPNVEATPTTPATPPPPPASSELDSIGGTPATVTPISTQNGSARQAPSDREKAARTATPKTEAETTVRVNTDRLDRLIDMVGELVIAHSVVAQDKIVSSDSDLLRKVTHSSKILRELQDISLKLRMVPLKATFQKMNRLVRDLSRKSGKSVAFFTEGDDTEIDRNMVDVISEPLVHMLRNSIDHGIELPKDRVAAGKQETANIWLRAYQQGGKVVIEIEDDGRGLNTEKIYAKAVARELIDPNKKVTDHEIHNFIFLPGFSTADQVTDLSGRGVGMDVVRRSIDQLQGKTDVSSTPGEGTKIALELPFTLAITDGMLVSVGEQRFIIPTINIDMTFQAKESDKFTMMGGSERVMFRGNSIPVIRLHELFGINGAKENISDAVLMVINNNKQKYALLIDEVLGQQHLVGKSINMPVKMQNISGGAILGDGQVGLILDTVALVS